MQTTFESKLAKEMEGKVYEHIWVTYFGGSYHVSKNYYIVENGTVFSLNGESKTPSGDSLEKLIIETNCLGLFRPNKPYKSKSASYLPAEFKKILKLQ
jgi:hypothetical protein